jgi:fibronectin type 3 domain-containing protein
MNISKTLILAIGTIVIAGVLFAGCQNSGLQSGTVSTQPTIRATTLSGTAAAGAPIASAQITLKDKYGMLKTIETGTDGKYSVDVSGMTAPFLLRITSGGTTTLYSTASDTGTVNIHPFTDLIIRSWYKAKGSDIDDYFVGTEPLASPPTASEIATIEAVVRSILSTWLTQVGLTETSFNLLTSPFDANSEGFDKVLDYTKVTIDTTGQVTVTSTDPTYHYDGTTISTNISELTTTDTTAPTDPSGLNVLPQNAGAMVLWWPTSTDNIGVAGYNIYRDDIKIGTSPYPVYTDTGLTVGTKYCYKVEAFDGTGNISNNKSGEACAIAAAAADIDAPTVPADVTATAGPSRNISLSWTKSTDNKGVFVYKVFRGTTEIATIDSTSYNDTGLTAGTKYCYTVKAMDASMNMSAANVPVCATTLALSIPVTTVWKSSFAGTIFDRTPSQDTTYLAMVMTQVGSSITGTIGYQDTLGRSGTTGLTGSVNGENSITVQFTDFDPSCASRTNTYQGTVGNSSMTILASTPSGGSCVAPSDYELTFALTTPVTYTASGTFLSSSSTLTLNTASSTFAGGRGLNSGLTVKTGVVIGAQTMTWDNDDSLVTTWRRASGIANDITGTWTAVNPSGNTFEYTFNAAGTFSHTANMATSASENTVVLAQCRSIGYTVIPIYSDPTQKAKSVVVTGPGITGSWPLQYHTSCSDAGGCWDSIEPIGTTHLTPPVTYTFTIRDASTTKTSTATVGCFMESLPSNLAVSKNASSGNLTITWTMAYPTNPSSNLKYHVQIRDSNNNSVWNSPSVIDAGTIQYTSPALTPGAQYSVNLIAEAFEFNCSSLISTTFTY